MRLATLDELVTRSYEVPLHENLYQRHAWVDNNGTPMVYNSEQWKANIGGKYNGTENLSAVCVSN